MYNEDSTCPDPDMNVRYNEDWKYTCPNPNMDIQESVNEIIAMGHTNPAEGKVTYIPEGDCIEVILSQDDYWAEWIDEHITYLYSRKTSKIIGVIIENVTVFTDRENPQKEIE